MSKQSDLHNRLAGKIVRSIVKPPLEACGRPSDVLVLLESVTAGVIHAMTKLGGDEIVLDVFVANLKDRLTALRLGDIKTEGSA